MTVIQLTPTELTQIVASGVEMAMSKMQNTHITCKSKAEITTPSTWTKCGDGEDDYQPLKDGQKTGWEVKFGGLTKREEFARSAMQALISSHNLNLSKVEADMLAKQAIQFADSLLIALQINS